MHRVVAIQTAGGEFWTVVLGLAGTFSIRFPSNHDSNSSITFFFLPMLAIPYSDSLDFAELPKGAILVLGRRGLAVGGLGLALARVGCHYIRT